MILLANLLLSTLPAVACPPLAGYFKAAKAADSPTYVVVRYEQSGCEKMEIGFTTVVNGKTVSESFPAITYVNRRRLRLEPCDGTCFYFEDRGEALRFFYADTVSFREGTGRIECAFDSADYSLTPAGDLQIAHNLTARDAADPCFAHRYDLEIVPRTTKP